MIYAKYPKYKQGDVWFGYHYINHRHNHVRNTMLRKEIRSKHVRTKWIKCWTRNNETLNVYRLCRIAFCSKKEL